MRIAIFTHSFVPKQGGSEIFHHNLACRLAAQGHEVTVVLPRKAMRALQAAGWPLPYRLAPFPGNIASWLKRCHILARTAGAWHLTRLQRLRRFDVWHGVMLFPTGVLLAPWARRNRVPHVIRTAGDDLISSRDGSVGLRGQAFINRLIVQDLPRLPALVVLSESMRQEALALGVAPERVHIIPNGVDWERFRQPLDAGQRAAFRKRYGLEDDAVVFVASGRNHRQKNYPCLLRAAAALASRGLSGFQILILGRETGELLPLVASLGLEKVVRVGEIHPEIPTNGQTPECPPEELVLALRCSDVFVMPSLLEGFSTALLEGMAAGLPVITTDAPGCADFVRHGRDALMVPAGSAEGLAEAMAKMLAEPQVREDYGQRSLRRSAEFGWDAVTAHYTALYRNLSRA